MTPRDCKRLAKVNGRVAKVPVQSAHVGSCRRGPLRFLLLCWVHQALAPCRMMVPKFPLLTVNEGGVSENDRDCSRFDVVGGYIRKPTLQETVKDPARFPWHEVKKVQHYWLEVDAMTQADLPAGRQVQVREDSIDFGGKLP